MRISRIVTSIIAIALTASTAYAGGSTAFSYQGRLLDAGEPANGLFDFEFELWNAEAGGSQIGSTQFHNAVPVAEGLFTLQIDFGANVFNNADRWLEMTVNTVLLSPRQPVTRVPYAIQTRGIFVDENQNVGIGTGDPNFQLSLGSTLSHTKIALYETSPTNHYGMGVVSGQFSFHLGGPGARYAFYDSDDLANELLTIDGNGNVGIGTTAPQNRLHVVSSGLTTIYAVNTDSGGTGVYGLANGPADPKATHYGVRGDSVNAGGFGVYSQGNCHVNGFLSKSSGAFKIDHPLDPENKYLQHSFVESPDMMNVYNGNVILDENGKALIGLPDYFDGLNRDFRYQLTPMGAAMPNLHIGQEIANNSFRIAGGKARMKVSWQVTGIRQDPWAQAHRIEVEPYKRPEHQGKYLNPELYGQPKEMGVHYFPHAERPVTETDFAKAQAGQTANPSTGGTK